MQIKVNVGKIKQAKKIEIYSGDTRFQITEADDGSLRIAKYQKEYTGLVIIPETQNVVNIQ